MSTRALCLAFVAAALVAPPAQAYASRNGMFVRESGTGQIEVFWRGAGNGAPDFWCAAGEYAQRRLHLPSTARLWRLSPPPRHAGEAVTFSLSPDGAAEPGLVMLGGDGKSLSLSHVSLLCED